MPTSTVDGQAGRPPAHLDVTDLAAGYGNVPVISDVSLTVGRGELVSVIGPNGAGKSTLLKAIVGIVRVLHGAVRLDGTDVTGYASNRLTRAGVGYVPQVRDVFHGLTVMENLEMGGYLFGSADVALRIEKVISIFPALGAMLRRNAAKLSGGERKMLAMARVLIMNPSLFILDEPTANLATGVALDLLNVHVRGLAEAGAAVLIVEQRASAALEVSDWTYVMVSGSVALSGPPRELTAREGFSDLFLGLPTSVGAPEIP